MAHISKITLSHSLAKERRDRNTDRKTRSLCLCSCRGGKEVFRSSDTLADGERERERQTLHHIHSVANNLKLQKTRLRRSIWVSGILGAVRC